MRPTVWQSGDGVRRWLVVGGVLASIACASDELLRDQPATVQLVGIVRDGADQPRAAVTVAGLIAPRVCPRPDSVLSFETIRTSTDSNGRYALLFQLPAPGLHCVRLTFVSATRRDTTVLVVPNVNVRFNNPDSVRADLAWP